MSTVRVKINRSAINGVVNNALGKSPIVKEKAYAQMNGLFNRAHRVMMKEFDRHPVTAEIDAGANTVNMSDTLDGYGNLFSFIGFYRGSKPTETLRELLRYGTNFRQTIYKNRGWYFKVNTPSKDEIAVATPMPWELGNSWAIQVEKAGGISGLSQYLFKRWEGSRSGRGVQAKGYPTNEGANFKPVSYLTEILNNFRESI